MSGTAVSKRVRATTAASIISGEKTGWFFAVVSSSSLASQEDAIAFSFAGRAQSLCNKRHARAGTAHVLPGALPPQHTRCPPAGGPTLTMCRQCVSGGAPMRCIAP